MGNVLPSKGLTQGFWVRRWADCGLIWPILVPYYGFGMDKNCVGREPPNAAGTLGVIGYVPHCWSALGGQSLKLKVQSLKLVRAAEIRSAKPKKEALEPFGRYRDVEGIIPAPFPLRLQGKRITPRGVGPHSSRGPVRGRGKGPAQKHAYTCVRYWGTVVGCCDRSLQPDGEFTRTCTASQNERDNQTKGSHEFLPCGVCVQWCA